MKLRIGDRWIDVPHAVALTWGTHSVQATNAHTSILVEIEKADLTGVEVDREEK